MRTTSFSGNVGQVLQVPDEEPSQVDEITLWWQIKPAEHARNRTLSM